MSRLDKPADFSALLEKYADSALLPRGGWNAGRGRSDSVPSRNEVIRERLSDRFRSTYHDRTRSYALRESEILAFVELGKFRVISTDDLSRFAYDGVRDRLEQDPQNLKKIGPYLATRNRRSLPILKVPPKKPKTASLQIRVEEDVGQQLDHYAEFIDASPS